MENSPLIVQHNINNLNRFFVCGDLHGMYHLLEKGLDHLNFDKTKDKLFSVGDLIDRGPFSHLADHYLDQPWFFGLFGNHEHLMLESVFKLKPFAEEYWEGNGGNWPANGVNITKMAKKIYSLPCIIEIIFFGKKIGIVHAGVPYSIDDWNEFLELASDTESDVLEQALWGRQRARALVGKHISNVDYVISGHTVFSSPVVKSNSVFIDTGAFYCSDDYHSEDRIACGLTVMEIMLDDNGELVFEFHFFDKSVLS